MDENYSIYEKHHRLCARNAEAASPILPFFGLHVRSLFGFLPKTGFFNMKLLRVLDLLNIGDNDNLREIGLLVHLRYLAIEYVPSSMGSLAVISSLVNLEFLVVHIIPAYYSIFIPSVMVKMMKLRYVKFAREVYFGEDCDSSQTNKLEFLSEVSITNLRDEEILKCSPHLRKVRCKCRALWAEEKGEYRYPDFSFFTQLESLSMTHLGEFRVNIFNLPLSIKKLTLFNLRWSWEKISKIGGLPNLKVLKLMHSTFEGKIWETKDGEFQQLVFLKLDSLDLVQWNVPTSEHLPKLRQLFLCDCPLQGIPSEIGEIATLQLIEVEGSAKSHWWNLLEKLNENNGTMETKSSGSSAHTLSH